MDDECPICLTVIGKDSNKLFTKCCNKKFHNNCFIDCMKIKQECPLCRADQTNHIIFIPSETTKLLSNEYDSFSCVHILKCISFTTIFIISINLFYYYF